MSRLGGARLALLCALALPVLALGQPAPQAKPQAKAVLERKAAPRKAAATKPEPPWLTAPQAAQRYQEALKADQDGHYRHAFVAYLEAAENGHGHAQKKLGEIYSRNGPVVKRDYETSLRWYEKARAQGVRIPKPAAFTKGH